MNTTDHSAARALSDLYEADGLSNMDFGDFVRIVADAAADPAGLSGGAVPSGYDPASVYSNLVGKWIGDDLAASAERIGNYFGAREDARHASARAGIKAANGASDADYDAALAAKAAGDPSPLLAMQVKYMSSF